ncbi:MAG: VCBS repeat-containing protein [Bacteroidota bacterium]
MSKLIFKNISFLLLLVIGSACNGDEHQFELLSPEVTGITFSNIITESEEINILKNEYIYNGGGIAAADFNKDGLTDLYFTANMASNKLYLNKGAFQFEDITDRAGVVAENAWSSGVAVTDINQDGWPDIYVCATNRPDSVQRQNRLFVHQGLNAENLPTFKEMAQAYGLADKSHTTNAAFFDYDNDGDLDVYLLVNEMDETKLPNKYKKKVTDGTSSKTDKLFRNDWNFTLGHPVFTDVSKEVGILIEGFGLGVNITDINQDGWKDIFVSNDYLTNDLLYINNGDGTFTDQADSYFKHTSASAMGSDVVDINNDGLADVIAVDMLPEDNYRKKAMLPANNYSSYYNNDRFGYTYQYLRNTLQLNQGKRPDNSGAVAFSEIAMVAGISATDWSWTPLVADFNNDGYRDIIITNGFPKDVTDRDFIDYHQQFSRLASLNLLLNQIPSVKIRNYAYLNNGDLTFSNVTNSWVGTKTVSFSNGAVYADLDNDGDLDYVVNNINDAAFVYQNNLRSTEEHPANWLRINLIGDKANPTGLGTKIQLFYGANEQQVWEQTTFRGYLSTLESTAHFGLGVHSEVKKLVCTWPNGQQQILENVAANQVLNVKLAEADQKLTTSTAGSTLSIFKEITVDVGINYTHQDEDFVDFNVQRLIPHKLSQYGPSIAVGDVNGDKLEDFFVGGSRFKRGQFFIQQTNGQFQTADLWTDDVDEPREETLGTLLFDVDNDGDNDLYLVNGGNEFVATDSTYQDQLYLNENGRFRLAKDALPNFLSSGSCVKAADYDQDGDLDLFVGGRLEPYQYPKPVSSYILQNNSTSERVKFDMASQEVAGVFTQMGMVCDALWTDYDNDGWQDLLIAGEWMVPTFFKNKAGKFEKVGTIIDPTTQQSITPKGWWNSLVAADFDQDGDMDYVLGNMGQNTLWQATDDQPVGLYAADFDNNGGYDAIPSAYFPTFDQREPKEYPYFGRMDMDKQIIQFKKEFPVHRDFGLKTMEEVLSIFVESDPLVLTANYMKSAYLENRGDGVFALKALPVAAQIAPIYGMIAKDFDGDGYKDLLLQGNDHGMETAMGKADAFNGLLLLGNGQGDFQPSTLMESGFYVPGDAKALAQIQQPNGQLAVVASQNKGALKVFTSQQKKTKTLDLAPMDAYAKITLPNGQIYKEEAAYGHTFLTQSTRILTIPASAKKVEIIDYQGNSRVVSMSTLSVKY